MSFAGSMKTIVVATDLQGSSEAALEYARKLATAYGARIVLAHGLDPLEYAAVESVPGRVLRRLTEEARASLDEMAADLIRDGIHSHTELRQGTVVRMLLDVIRQHHAGLIVLGTRGRRGAGPLAVGTIAEQVVRLAPCPVLAVAADWNAGEHRPAPGGSVLLAMDRNEALEAAVDAASALALTFQRNLIAIHARTAAEASACGASVTLSPKASRVTTMPSRLSSAAAAMASSTVMPATKRCETRRPMEELSENLRKGLLVERPMKKERSMQELA